MVETRPPFEDREPASRSTDIFRGVDTLTCRKLPIQWDFITTYIHTAYQGPNQLHRDTAHDTVKKLREAPDGDRNGIFNTFLMAEGAYHSERCSHLISQLDDPWDEEVEKIVSRAAWDFSRSYKQVAMGPLALMIAEELVAANPEHITPAPTTSASFKDTVASWVDDAVAAVAEENATTALWERFKHAADISCAVMFAEPGYAKESIIRQRYSLQKQKPEQWLKKSFLNTMPFVSDLILEAAVSYARQRPDNLTPEALTGAVHGWLPYLEDLESTFEHTQDLVVFGAPLAQQRWKHDRQHPGRTMRSAPARWLDALKSYETGNPEALFECAEQCAPSVILQTSAPGPVHPSLKNGPLPAHHSGFCGGQFRRNTAAPSEEAFSAASTMLLSCTKAAARTLFSDPTCIQAIRDGALVVNATPIVGKR